MSDVTGDKLDIISSGPTVPDMSTPRMCHDIFQTLGIEENVPKTVNTALTKADVVEMHGLHTENKSTFNHVQNIIVGSNFVATQSAYDASSKLGYVPFVLSTELEGEAKALGSMFAKLAKYIMFSFSRKNAERDSKAQVAMECELIDASLTKHTLNEIIQVVRKASNSEERGVCIIAGGETIVHVNGSGVGGRNQELIVSCGIEINEIIKDTFREKFTVEFLSCGTDGQDGPTSAAGGVVDIKFIEECLKSRVDPVSYLENNDTYTLLSKVRNGQYLVNTGFTGTNVMDIQLLIVKQL